MDTIVCPPPAPIHCSPFRLFLDLILMETIVCPPPSTCALPCLPLIACPYPYGHYSLPTSLPCSLVTLPPMLVSHPSCCSLDTIVRTSLPCSLPPSLVFHSSGFGDFALCLPPQTRHRMDTTLCLSAGVVRACKINHLRNALVPQHLSCNTSDAC